MHDITQLDRPPYRVDPSALKRYDQRDDAFGVSPWRGTQLAFDCGRRAGDAPGALERCGADNALSKAAEAFERHCIRHFCGLRDAAAQPPVGQAGPASADPAANADNVKLAARRMGADLVGICKLNPAWVYARDRQGNAVELPERYQWAVVMGIAMDAGDIVADGSGPSAHMATMVGYMKMGLCASAMSLFIRQMGCSAAAACNGLALSIPLAIDAGLGELGRNGLLVTPQFGPCVRVCKVLTDMPLVADRPIAFGVEDFCKRCRRCVEACRVDAVSSAVEPSFQPACRCTRPGVRRWAVDGEKCFAFWLENGGSCSACIAACPYTMIGWENALAGRSERGAPDAK